VSVNKQGVFTYSHNPASGPRDQVRFLIGDTDSSDPLLYDGEIDWLNSQYGSPMHAAIRACETIISKFSRQADESVGQVKITFSQRAKAYNTTLSMLRARLAMEDSAIYAGGISVSDKQTQDQNSDRVRPDFTKHMMENYDIAPWTTQTQYWLWLNMGD
jgi:hypothetical protein